MNVPAFIKETHRGKDRGEDYEDYEPSEPDVPPDPDQPEQVPSMVSTSQQIIVNIKEGEVPWRGISRKKLAGCMTTACTVLMNVWTG